MPVCGLAACTASTKARDSAEYHNSAESLLTHCRSDDTIHPSQHNAANTNHQLERITMSREVSHISEFTVNGVKMAESMNANRPAWHRLGTVFNPDGTQAPDAATAIVLSHTDYHVSKEPIFLEGDSDAIPEQYATTRIHPETGKRMVLGIVGSKYVVQQNIECFNFLDSLCQDGIMRYESAFSMRGGQKLALLARMPSVDTIAEGDSCLRYILMTNSHDGSGAITLTPTSVRVVCANTVRIAMRKGKGMTYAIRHTAGKEAQLKQARQYISQFDEQFTLFRDQAQLIATKRLSPGQGHEYLRQLFPEPKQEDKKAHENWTTKTDRIAHLYKHGEKNTMPAIRGTWWSLFNAVTEFIDHESKFRGDFAADNKFESLTTGTMAGFKEKAFALAVQMA